MNPLNLLSVVALVLVAVPLAYLVVLALASAIPSASSLSARQPTHRFVIAIPAHDEEDVIAATVGRLRQLDYPGELFAVHVVADHCSDQTAALAHQAGAVVHERQDGPRSGKGAALSWLLSRVLASDCCDAVVIFDGDTRVDPRFLRVMDSRLALGDDAVQGQHIISNPGSGWFPALTWAMFLVDNRFGNLGRTRLGLSCKNMGDSICFRADVLRKVGWGEGLTEDYQLRQRLLLEGIRISYEPRAIGYGEAVLTWRQARAQRARWLRGTHDASSQFATRLLRQGVIHRQAALLDGAVQAYFPSYSTLTVVSATLLVAQLLASQFVASIAPTLLGSWWAVVVILFLYPLFGLALERAPLRAYLAILSGPVFILWRSWLAYRSRFTARSVIWVRTSHGDAAARR
ncbi:MAG: glycosyltransferase family 2 protein [Chloroflexota bacterium]